MLVNVENISFDYSGQKIFDNFSIKLGQENPTVILGPPGCGNTTLLKLIAGLLKPGSGKVVFRDNGEVRESVQKSLMFQDTKLLPWLTTYENVMLPIKKKMPKKEAAERVMRFLTMVSLERKAKLNPLILSAGEKQRASMARAFAFNAPLLLLDAPFRPLDVSLRVSLMDTLLAILNIDSRTCIIVTHDPGEALYMGKRIIILNKAGRQKGKAVIFDELSNRQKHSYAGAENCEEGKRLIRVLRQAEM